MLHLNYTHIYIQEIYIYVHLLQEEQRGICDQLIDSPVCWNKNTCACICSVYAFVKYTRTLTIHTRMHTHIIYIHTYGIATHA